VGAAGADADFEQVEDGDCHVFSENLVRVEPFGLSLSKPFLQALRQAQGER